jgi:hypothetical protein
MEEANRLATEFEALGGGTLTMALAQEAEPGGDLEQINCRKMQAASASPKASRPAPVVAPGEPEEVVTTAKKSRSRNALEASWCEDRTALVSTYGYRLHGAKAQAAPRK